MSEDGDSNMAPTAVKTYLNPPSPTASCTSAISADCDIKELIQYLPFKACLGSEIRQVSLRVQDLKDNRGTVQAQLDILTSRSEVQETHIS
ncbi:Hypothetical predicted protein [Pelobates cultripes]|uniref:Uncharacterized protein n=1 Tax=Pelobates cultripes TaxID=61616 RepID=A0AAD1TGL8_PELCU|nr:Hypothetical predicted protein [Pelobates cultripes]